MICRTSFIKKLFASVFILPYCALLFAKPASAGDSVKVAILPFFVHSQEDIGYMGRAIPDMLSTRLGEKGEISTIQKPALLKVLSQQSWEHLDEEKAVRIGKDLGADFIVTGSLTQIGRTASLDISVIDTGGTKTTRRLFLAAEDVSNIPGKMQELARRLNFVVLDKVIVSKVKIAGNRFIEKDAVLFNIRTKTGDVFSPEVLQEDLKTIYQMGYFKDIQITSTDTVSGKEITFSVKEKPMVRSIQINGNKKVKIDDIKKVIEVKPRTILDLNKVVGDVERIKKVYVDKGYYSIEVSHKVNPIDEYFTAVDYFIKENEVVKVKKVTFSGNSSIKAKKLVKVMETREKHWLLSLFTTRGLFKDTGLEKDMDRLVAYYYSKGFLQVVVEEPRVEFEKDGVCIHFNIVEGNCFTIGEVDFKGDLIYDTGLLKSKLKSASGRTFNGQTLNDDLVALKALYSEKGFAFADVSPLTKIKPEENKVNVLFDITKGEKIFVEEIRITGNTRTRDNVIRRELRLSEGAVYNSEQIKRSKQEINNLGFFEKVNINTEPGTASNLVKLDVEVKERPTGSFSIGAGYSSVDSVVGMFQVSQNNLFGKGQQLSLMAQLGGHSNYYNLSFTEPWFRDTRVSVGFDLFNIEREYEDFDRDSNGINLRAGFPLDKYYDYTRFYLTYRYEVVDIDVVYDDVSLEIQEQEGTNITSSITGSIARDSRDDRWKPRQGSHHSLSLELAGLGGDSQFVGLIASSAKYFPLPLNTAFMIRGTIGQLFGYGGEDVPISEKFFLGGLGSLRGFEVRSVGPKKRRPLPPSYFSRRGKTFKYQPPRGRRYSDEWDTVGGEKELYFNFEYLFPILEEAGVRGSVFVDAGNAYEEGESFFSDLRYDVGVGVNWYSPFGPLRLVWGYNLDPISKYDEDASNFEFSMGRMF
jgi:outer membrane protein insertion porin family